MRSDRKASKTPGNGLFSRFLAAWLLAVSVAACAQQPPTLTHWARLDGLRKAQNPWIEQDFHHSERFCQLSVGAWANPTPRWVEPSTHSRAGADLAEGVANIARGETIRMNRENAMEACMMKQGYFIERID